MWLRNIHWRSVYSLNNFVIVAESFWGVFQCLFFFYTDPVQGRRPPEGVGAVAENVGGQGLGNEGQGHVVERGEGHERGMEGMADTDQRLCVNSFHVNMYFTYTLQNIFVINQMCSFSLSNKISNYSLHVLFFILLFFSVILVHCTPIV